LLGHFVQQFVQFTGLNELGDVVVGVEAFTCSVNALADLHGNRNAFVFDAWQQMQSWRLGFSLTWEGS
jgi:hypothetical protein